MKDNARKRAEVIISEAEVKAEKILNKSHTRLAQLHEDIAELKRQRTQIEIQIRSVLEAHSRLLDMSNEEKQAIEEEESKLRFLQK
jgi:cell division initiation protein